MADSICILCKESGGEMRTIQRKALNTLIDSSKKRRDNKYKIWQTMQSATIHTNCSKNYNKEASIRKHSAEFSENINTSKKILKDSITFDFESLCIFCGRVCDAKESSTRLISTNETRNKIVKTVEERNVTDEFNKTLLARLGSSLVEKDVVALGARYHSNCMSKFYTPSVSEKVGRPPKQSTLDFIQHVADFIHQNKSESQFSLCELKETFAGDHPDIETIKSKLKKYYGDDQLEFIHTKTDVVIMFKHKISKQVWKDWYTNQESNKELERKRIIEMAGQIILEDIRKKIFDKKNYVIPNFDESNIYDNIPESLTNLLDIVIKSHKDRSKKKSYKWKKRVATISHSIMTLARPRSFLSPILLGLSSMLHKKYGSRELIDSLSYLGLCASYDETDRFESSIIYDPENHTCKSEGFVQFIYDNADHNTRTIDGKNTFHAMGGIKVVTPASCVVSKKTIARVKNPSSDSIGKFGFYPLQRFEKLSAKGLKAEIQDVFHDDFTRPKIAMEDFTWLFSKYSNKKSKGWGGFMEDFHSNSNYKKSKVIPLPFVNHKADDYDTVYTVLLQAAQQNKIDHPEDICFVTFDQPLYLKAKYILSCILQNIESGELKDEDGFSKLRIRLGGFHTLLSFLGSIGSIMEGSGLKEAFSVIYSEKTAEYALGGHDYAKAIRAHFLVQVAIANSIFESVELTDYEKEILNGLLSNVGTENFKEDINKEEFQNIRDKFMEKINELQKRGPTAQLWIQYWDMLNIVRDFIKAERSGDWNLHLKCIERMIPYFHATVHNHYAKCAHLYLQDMLNLKDEMNEYQYAAFTKDGYFTIRRSEKFWSGVWSDMTIEQFLMRSMKTQGGLTHGRGMGEKAITVFILTMIILVEVCNVMENFCNVSSATSHQHVDSSDSRITQDSADLLKISEFFAMYNPFPETSNIMSIYSGIVGDDSIKCHEAYEIGFKAVKQMIGKNFESVTYPKKSRVLSLKCVQSSIKINDDTVPIDPLLLFQRISANIMGPDDMAKYLESELSPLPLSLFTEHGFRKNVKSQLYEQFTSIQTLPSNKNVVHVIDGGYLLHKVIWEKNDTVEIITEKYQTYIQKHFSKNSSIVFDGYPEEEASNKTSTAPATKTAERLRRKNTSSVPFLKIELQTKIPYLPEKFLSNDKNKSQLIKVLSTRFRYEGFDCYIAEEDADALIVRTAIDIASQNKNISNEEKKKTVVIVGQDVDLLVLLNQLNTSNYPIYFLKAGAGNVSDAIYSSNSFNHENHRSIIAFLHSFTGCDTTSAFAGKGKKTTVNLLLKATHLTELAAPFYKKDAKPEEISENGCKLIRCMYDPSNIYKKEKEKNVDKSKLDDSELSLNELRFFLYKFLTSKSSFKLEKIPPTVGAATQHSYRVYYQLQTWLGNKLSATDWGWKERLASSKKILMPHFTDDSVIPESLLKRISCSCTTGCNNRCGCRKLGLHCTVLCTKCHGSGSCTNVERISIDLAERDNINEPEQPALRLNFENHDEENNETFENITELNTPPQRNQDEVCLIHESENDNQEPLPKRRKDS